MRHSRPHLAAFCGTAAIWFATTLFAATGDLDATIAPIFERYDSTSSPGCALGIVRDGALVYAAGFGMANLDYAIANRPATVFRTGSVGKQFTAATIASLALDGSLSLDDPVRRFLPELPDYQPAPTVRHLIHHTSGVRDYLTLMRLAGKRDDDFYTDAEVLAMLARQRELNFAPGTDHLYSNSGYFLLSQIVRRATGRSLRQVADERLFRPLGMRHTHYHDDHTEIVGQRASGYAPAADGGYRISMTTLEMVGDGGVFTSIEDIAHWLVELDQRSVLGARLHALIRQRGAVAGKEIGYAFGLSHGVHRGLETFGHGGAFVGFRAAVLTYPAQHTGIAVLCNVADAPAMELAKKVGAAVLGDRMKEEPEQTPIGRQQIVATAPSQPLSDAEVELYAGRYSSEELDVIYTLALDGEALIVRVPPAIALPLTRSGPDRLTVEGLASLRFERGADGRPNAFLLDAGRVRNLRFTRLP